MPINWTDPQADAKLLVGIITLHNVKLDHKALAEFMGQECTASAIQHRVQRIKDKVRTDPTVEGTIAGTSPGAAPQQEEGSTSDLSPTKPKRGRPAKRGAKGSPTKKHKANVENDSA
ncbi:AT hook motif protein [Aspergillus bombycis]|uniref:AT hook motif protein n=1 Tax=Aspergillus bombycis TaxID=109264 RepID=A0A1F8A1V3_9EURO|nr:AT hook motif protein [Aspergillus bombycis]OGM45710.1 AT hook motif protein [Aspergillus bombycis]